MKKPHILMLIVLLAVVCWIAYSGITPGPSSPNAGVDSHRPGRRTTEAESAASNRGSKPPPRRPSAQDGLDGVSSALARRYLRFMLPGGLLDGQSYDQSLIHNAFKQAWCVNARIDLSEAQQDRMAEFLLEQDWSKWGGMDPGQVEKWARQHLTDGQRAALMDFIEESRQGEIALSQMRLQANMREYAADTPEGAFTAEMLQARRIAELMAGDTDNLSPEELEIRKRELKELMEAGVSSEHDEKAPDQAQARGDEQAYQLFNLLADRIPMTDEQQVAVYEALRDGANAASNPYDYQSLPPERVEAQARADTSWMGDLLTNEQYGTYLRHYLAEIEMIRFQSRR